MQVAPAGIVAPGGSRFTFPGVTVTRPGAPHPGGVIVTALVTSRFAGRASKNVIPFRVAVLLGFLMVIVNVDVPATGTCFGEKSFVMMGGARTVKILDAGRPVPPSTDVIGLVTLL